MKHFVVPFSCVLLSLAACAQNSTPAAVAAVAAPPTSVASAASSTVVAQQYCHRESKVGTNFFQTVCETSTQEHEDMKDGVARMKGPQAAGRGYSKGN